VLQNNSPFIGPPGYGAAGHESIVQAARGVAGSPKRGRGAVELAVAELLIGANETSAVAVPAAGTAELSNAIATGMVPTSVTEAFELVTS
jgi:hypothetical protein